MSELKEGKRVEFIGEGSIIHNGATGTIVSMAGDSCRIELDSTSMTSTGSSDKIWSVPCKQLKLIGTSTTPVFKEGDEVEVISNGFFMVRPGDRGVVSFVHPGGAYMNVDVRGVVISGSIDAFKHVGTAKNTTGSVTSETPPSYDYINPSHYKKGDMEVWQMMVKLYGVEAYILHCRMCAFKYRMRLGDKPGQPIEQDLKKAKWYEDMANDLTNNRDGILNQFENP